MTLAEPIRCPECEAATSPGVVGGITLDVCPVCGGIWFGGKELCEVLAKGAAALDELMGFEPAVPHSARAQSSLFCPECRIVLHVNQLADAQEIAVHSCYQCAGVYLDGASLARLDHIYRNPGEPQAPHLTTLEEQKADQAMMGTLQDDVARTAALYNLLDPTYRSRNRMWDYWKAAGL